MGSTIIPLSRKLAWPFLVLASLLIIFVPWPISSQKAPASRSITIEASQFAYSPGEIHLNPGDIATIHLISADVIHSLYLDDYHLSLTAAPGYSDSLTFTASKPGVFRFRCSVPCGAMHPFMIGKLIVGANSWLYRSIALALLAVVAAGTLWVPYPTPLFKS